MLLFYHLFHAFKNLFQETENAMRRAIYLALNSPSRSTENIIMLWFEITFEVGKSVCTFRLCCNFF